MLIFLPITPWTFPFGFRTPRIAQSDHLDFTVIVQFNLLDAGDTIRMSIY